MIWALPAQAVLVTLTATGTPGSFKTGAVDATGLKQDGDLTGLSQTGSRGWASFDLSAIPAGALISSATVRFTTFGSTASGATSYIGGFAGDPAALNGLALYALLQADAASNFGAAVWTTSPALNSVPLNTSGLTYLMAYAGNNQLVISYVEDGFGAFNLYGYGGASGTHPELEINYTPPVPCAGMPTPGSTLASLSAACPLNLISFGLSGILPGTGGLTYQWQTSVGGGAFAPVTGATNPVWAGKFSTTTAVQCVVTCAATGQSATSIPVTVSIGPLTSCYCSSAAMFNGDDDIGQIMYGSLVNPSVAPSPLQNNPASVNTYTDYTALPPAVLFTGISYPISIQQINGGNFYDCYAKVFIDLNQDGDLTDPGEEVFGGQTTNLTGLGADLLTGNITIPATAIPGQTLMRVVLEEGGDAFITGPCTQYTWGETEDYTLLLVEPVPCAGAVAGTTASSDSAVCAGESFSLSLAGALVAANLSYQWQASTDSLIWSDIAGANAPFLSSSQTDTTWYRCVMTCSPSLDADTSGALRVDMASWMDCYCTSAATAFWGTDIRQVTVGTFANPAVLPAPTGGDFEAYTDYTALGPIPLHQGSLVPVSVVQELGSGSIGEVSIYVDFDQNGIFDFSEELFSGTVSSNGQLSGIGQIPYTALPGLTTLRVIMADWGAAPLDPCSLYDTGETEDYRIQILPALSQNVQLLEIINPVSGCNLTACEDLNFSFQNVGTDTINTFSYSYQVNGGSPVTATVALAFPAAPGDVVAQVIPCALNMLTPGLYNISVALDVAGDTDPLLNSLGTVVTSVPEISTFPYVQHFDNPAFPGGGWLASADPLSDGANSWQLTSPALSVINAPTSAPNSWLASLTGAGNEVSWVESPCLDFSGLQLPVLEMNVWWDAQHDWAGAMLQASVNGGSSWSTIGSVGSGQNWYNNGQVFPLGNVAGATGEGWSGSGVFGSGGWLPVLHDLTGTGLAANVKLRIVFASSWAGGNGFAFDDVKIYDTPPHDASIKAIVSPETGECGDDSLLVQVVVKNAGLNPESNIPLTVQYTNGAGVAGSITTIYPGPLLPATTDTLVVGTFNALVGGNFWLTGFSSLPGDGLLLNDTARTMVHIQPVPATPLVGSSYKCKADTFHFAVTNPNAGATYTWFDALAGGNVLATGPALVTPAVSQTTSFYVAVQEDAAYDIPVQVGPEGPSWGSFLSQGLDFSNQNPMTLDSLTIYPAGDGFVQLVAYDQATGLPADSGDLVFVTPATAGAAVRIPVNIEIPTAGYWSLQLATNSTTVPDLHYSFALATFPYVAGGVSIDDNTDGSGVTWGSYYYFYDWKVTTLGCFSERAAAVAGIYPTPVLSLGPDQTGCSGSLLDAGTGWNSTAWYMNGVPAAQTQSYFAAQSGMYACVVTDGNGCAASDTVFTQVFAAPVVELGNDTTVCGGLTLNAGNAGATFAWGCAAPPVFSQLLTVSLSGTYCVTVTNGFGCQASDQINVAVNPAPAVALGSDRQTCAPVQIGPMTAPGGPCQWTLPDGSLSNSCTLTATTTGTYTLAVTDTNGCTGTDDIEVVFQAPPVVNIGQGGTDTLCAALPLNAGNPGATYLWALPLGGSATSQGVMASTSGWYKVFVTSNIGCVSQDSVQLIFSGIPTQLAYVTASAGQPFTYTFTATHAPVDAVQYHWTFTTSGGTIFTATGNPVTQQFPGQDWVEVKLMAHTVCGNDSTSGTLLVSGLPAPTTTLRLYPNPSDGVLFVEAAADYPEVQVSLSDLQGRELLTRSLPAGTLDAPLPLDLRMLAKGIYLMRFSSALGTAVYRIALQ